MHEPTSPYRIGRVISHSREKRKHVYLLLTVFIGVLMRIHNNIWKERASYRGGSINVSLTIFPFISLVNQHSCFMFHRRIHRRFYIILPCQTQREIWFKKTNCNALRTGNGFFWIPFGFIYKFCGESCIEWYLLSHYIITHICVLWTNRFPWHLTHQEGNK